MHEGRQTGQKLQVINWKFHELCLLMVVKMCIAHKNNSYVISNQFMIKSYLTNNSYNQLDVDLWIISCCQNNGLQSSFNIYDLLKSFSISLLNIFPYQHITIHDCTDTFQIMFCHNFRYRPMINVSSFLEMTFEMAIPNSPVSLHRDICWL